MITSAFTSSSGERRGWEIMPINWASQFLLKSLKTFGTRLPYTILNVMGSPTRNIVIAPESAPLLTLINIILKGYHGDPPLNPR